MFISISIKNEKVITDAIAIIKLLVIEAKIIDIVTSVGESGAAIISTMLPIIFPIKIEDDECENACWITCIAIKPGARKLIKGTPNTLALSSPRAKEITNKKRTAEIIGANKVCAHTVKNLKISFLYKCQAPTQFINPNLLDDGTYLFSSSCIVDYIYCFFTLIVNKV